MRKEMVIDLHVHTIRGASDSTLTPSDAVAEAKRIGLDGVCLTEHGSTWDRGDRYELENLARQYDLVVIRGTEVATDLGHIVVFGLDGYIRGIYRAEELRRVVDEVGGFMIAAHPFRMSSMAANLFQAVERALSRPLFSLVHELEVLNGACSSSENLFALKVARRLGMRGTGGSDAHSAHGLGCFTTVFERDIENEQDLIRELRAGRFYPAAGFLEGSLVPYVG